MMDGGCALNINEKKRVRMTHSRELFFFLLSLCALHYAIAIRLAELGRSRYFYINLFRNLFFFLLPSSFSVLAETKTVDRVERTKVKGNFSGLGPVVGEETKW